MKSLRPDGGAQIEPGARPSGPASLFASRLLRRDFRPERAEHAAPDLAVGPDLVFVVVHGGPRLERGLGLRVELARRRPAIEPEGGQTSLQLAHDVDPEPQDILRVLAVQQGEIVDGEDPIQFRDGSRVVVDADVDPAVVESAVPALVADDEEGGGLLSAAIASRSLAGIEGREEPD